MPTFYIMGKPGLRKCHSPSWPLAGGRSSPCFYHGYRTTVLSVLTTQHYVQRPLPTSQSKPVKQFLTFLNSSHPANHFLSSAYLFFIMSLASSFHSPHTHPPYFTPGSLKGFQLDFLFLVFPKSFKLKITWERLCSILSLAKLGDCQPVRQNNFRNLQV